MCLDTSDKSEELRRAALKAVAHYSYPGTPHILNTQNDSVEFVPGIRNLVIEKGIFIPFMDLISSGDLDAHQEIDRKELRLENVIHEGTASKGSKIHKKFLI